MLKSGVFYLKCEKKLKISKVCIFPFVTVWLSAFYSSKLFYYFMFWYLSPAGVKSHFCIDNQVVTKIMF